MSKGKIHWEVMVEGFINNIEFKRHWKMPSEVGSAQSSIIIPDSHKEATHHAMTGKAEASVARQIQTETTSDGLNIVSEQGHNKSMSEWHLLKKISLYNQSLTNFYLHPFC